jgi:hypothetical protein
MVWLPVRAAAALVACAALAQAGEMPFKDVPKPVQQAVMARFKGAKVVGAAQEKGEDGTTVFEINLRDKGRSVDVILAPSGAMTTIEKQILLGDLPKPASEALAKQYPKARYKLVEEIYKVADGKETLAYYEALLMDSGKQVWAVELGGDGKMLNVEKRKGFEEDAD